ncbi:MAG: FAD-dependent oxidoreductase [Gammaproteobacteria bacterium]|nr:FAD-dependent oxidoreductase [Gammaproteobacteria bacterium]
MQLNPDIVIIGGGLVGLSAALALQHPDRHISIIESSALEQKVATGLSARSIALSYASVQIFKALGLWDDIKTTACPIKTIHISSQGEWGVTRLQACDYDLEALGYIIESATLGALLLDRVRRSKLISLNTGAEFESAHFSDKVKLRYRCQDQSQEIEASLVLIADGTQSKARSSLGIEHRTVDYAQAAIITNVEVSKPTPGIAYERFTQSGPLAMLPLGRNRYACVWTQDPDFSRELMQLDDEEFAASLQRSFGYRLGFLDRIGPRYSFPLYRTEALGLVKDRCLLIGNAANTLHPVAGQGLNLALRDVASLTHLFEDATIGSLDGHSIKRLLENYQSSRVAEQRQVVRLGDGMVSLFSNDLPVLKQFRAGALALLDIVPALKAEVAMSGMGFSYAGNPMLRGRMR